MSFFRSFSSKIFASKLNATKLATMVGFGTAAGYATYSSLFQGQTNGQASMLVAQQEPALHTSKFTSYKLKEVKKVNHNTAIFRFDIPNNQALDLPVSSCVVTGFVGQDDKLITRPYTPISSSDQRGYFDLMVKKYDKGPMSTHIHNLKVGDTLDVKGPFTKLPIVTNMKKKIGMIAGGTGISPMYQVLNHILADKDDKTEISLIFANVKSEDILLKDELDALAKKHDRFKVFYTLDKPSDDWKQGKGFVSKKMIKKHLPSPSKDSIILVCGPNQMLESISGPKGENFTQGKVGGILKKLKYEESMVYKF